MSLTRRAFAATAVAVAATAVSASAPASVVPHAREPRRKPTPQAQEPGAEARALGEWVRARYGDRLTANQFADVLRDIEAGVRRAARLSAPPLTNADEPDFVFRAYRGPE